MKKAIILIFGFVATCFSTSAQLTEQQQIQKLNFVYNQIRNNYVDDVPLEPLVEEAIIATIKELDPHSQYLSREDMANLRTRTRGEFAGVGIRYMVHNDTIVVRSIIDSSPAYNANIYPNDRIIAIDDQPAIGLSTDNIATLLRGDVGSKLTLRVVRRHEPTTLDIKLKREYIDNSAISASYRIGDIGYIAISTFSKRLASDFYGAYKNLGDIKALIIDLRDNTGGALTAAIDLSSLFLNKDDIIASIEGRSKQEIYRKNQDKISLTIPVVVIINENSASASEMFAGAMQDHDRGVIIGHTSFGKGLVQRVIDLKDGTGITLTIARYKTPSGRVIQRPYEMGKMDEYKQDSLRYMHPDSIPHNHELLFRTLHNGRKIYGGGGITPDVYINTDSIQLSQPLVKAYADGIFERTIIEYCDRISTETLHQSYPTVDSFNTEYDVEAELLDIFYSLAGYQWECITAIDRSFIQTLLMATLAEQLYGKDARHYVYAIRFDDMVQHALEIADDHVLQKRILGY